MTLRTASDSLNRRVIGLALLLGLIMQLFVLAGSASAITAEEMLDDPGLESRARALSKQLRCLVCQNQSIDDSDAELAQDLRREVRAQLVAGASDAEILASLQSKYGDYVLLRPPVSTGTYILWFAPVGVVLGGIMLVVAIRRNRRLDAPTSADTAKAQSTRDVDGHLNGDVRMAGQTPKASNIPRSPIIIVVVLGFAASLGLYLMLGRADLADQPLAGRQAEIAAAATAQESRSEVLAKALTEARQTVNKAPDKVEGWLRLAMAAAAAGDNDTELDALRTALDLTAGDPSIKAMLAEALSRAADAQITIPARNLIDEVLAVNPNEPRALYMAGLAAYQDENFADAVALWQRLHSQSRPDAPWMATLGQNIIDAAEKGGLPVPDVAPSPDQGMLDMAAGMSDEERAEMIEGMVATLAARLAENTDDLNGWLRLARAYDVLGRQEDMVRAMIGAADAVPDDARQQTMALEVMVTSNLGAQFLDATPRLLARLEALAPDGLELLFFKGHFARLSGDPEAARQNWQLLLERLPADSPLAANLKARIDQL